jgi:hypothetical protein
MRDNSGDAWAECDYVRFGEGNLDSLPHCLQAPKGIVKKEQEPLLAFHPFAASPAETTARIRSSCTTSPIRDGKHNRRSALESPIGIPSTDGYKTSCGSHADLQEDRGCSGDGRFSYQRIPSGKAHHNPGSFGRFGGHFNGGAVGLGVQSNEYLEPRHGLNTTQPSPPMCQDNHRSHSATIGRDNDSLDAKSGRQLSESGIGWYFSTLPSCSMSPRQLSNRTVPSSRKAQKLIEVSPGTDVVLRGADEVSSP